MSIYKEKIKSFILKCKNYDGGFGLSPKKESHSGGIYLSLKLIKFFNISEDQIINKPKLIKWLVNKQDMGFSGRVNKSIL